MTETFSYNPLTKGIELDSNRWGIVKFEKLIIKYGRLSLIAKATGVSRAYVYRVAKKYGYKGANKCV